MFEGGRPRPAHIQIPLDVATTEAVCCPGRRPVSRPGATTGRAFDEAVRLIDRARSPFIIAGGGTVDCADAVSALAERIAAPVATTIAAKGVLPDDHALALGAPLTDAAGRASLAEADLVIAVGTELAASDTWVDRLDLPTLVRIDIEPGQAAANYPAATTLTGDAGTILSALEATLAAAGPVRRRKAEKLVAAARARCRVEPGSLQARHVAVLRAMRRGLGRDGFLAADMAQSAYTANVHFPCYAPRRYFYPTGLSTLGFALPVAIGARLAAPEVPAAVLIGDGGFMFTATELATAVELGMGLPVVIWNNHGLAQIRMHMANRGIPAVGVDSLNPDFMALARAFGCHALRPGSLDELAETIAAAQNESVPTVIEVRDEDSWTA